MAPPTVDVSDVLLPDTTVPKTIGLLNMIFGGLLLLCGICSGIYVAWIPLMQPMMQAQQQQFDQQMAAERQKQLADLRQQEKQAKSDEERQPIVARRKHLEAQPLPKMPNMGDMSGLSDPWIRGFYAGDLGSGLLMNILMIVAGIGLVNYRAWGRTLGVWVAGIKIVRLIGLYTYAVLWIVPIQVQAFLNMVKEMSAGQPGAQNPDELAKFATTMGIMMSVSWITIMVLGIIYPAVSLWLLTRPYVKQACD